MRATQKRGENKKWDWVKLNCSNYSLIIKTLYEIINDSLIGQVSLQFDRQVYISLQTDLHGRRARAELFHSVTGQNGYHASRVIISVALGDGELAAAVHHLVQMPGNRAANQEREYTTFDQQRHQKPWVQWRSGQMFDTMLRFALPHFSLAVVSTQWLLGCMEGARGVLPQPLGLWRLTRLQRPAVSACLVQSSAPSPSGSGCT